MAGSTERVAALNAQLWSYGHDSFLPHGSAEDGHGALQPIWLTHEDENPNRASVLFTFFLGGSQGAPSSFEGVPGALSELIRIPLSKCKIDEQTLVCIVCSAMGRFGQHNKNVPRG